MTVRDLFKRFFKRLLRLIFWLWLWSTVYLVACKWIMPPITLTQIMSVIEGHGLQRDYVDYSEMAPAAKLAAMASEDQLFPDHNGFDWKSIEKSMQAKPGKRKKVRGAGASTITQQVAKNVFLWQGSGIMRYVRKLPEVYFTVMIEWIWGKERILEVYLNIAEMGPGIFGIEAASQAYFSKPAISLSRAQAAMIIASLPSPKRYTVKPVSRWVNWRYPRIMQQMSYIEGDPDVQLLIHPPKKDKKKVETNGR